MITQLKSDPFARMTLLRERIVLTKQDHRSCEWCGNDGTRRRGPRVLYRYGWFSDSHRGYQGAFSDRLFCGVNCYRDYAGQD